MNVDPRRLRAISDNHLEGTRQLDERIGYERPAVAESLLYPELSWPIRYGGSVGQFADAGEFEAGREGISPGMVQDVAAEVVAEHRIALEPKGLLDREVPLGLSPLDSTVFLLSIGFRGYRMASEERAQRAEQQIA